jgi:hypothetical protein
VVAVALAVRNAHGSGVADTEYRELAPFATVELAGENTVTIRVGPAQSVAVTADEDLIDRVTTTVRSGRIIIANEGRFTPATRMSVAVSVPSLDRVVLSGSGTVTVEGVTGTDFVADLSGTGTLAASGTVDHLTAMLSDTGTVDLQRMIARDAISPSVTTHNTGTGSVTGG